MAANNDNFLLTIYNDLESNLTKKMEALPKDLNKQRFLQNCMTVLKDPDKDFSKCDPATVVNTLVKGAFLGLDFFNKECYAIPFGSQCQFLTDYKGEIKLCKKYSRNKIKDIYAKLVRKGDVFEEVIANGVQTVNFNPIPFNDKEILGAFAVVYYADGSMMYETMSKLDIEHTRNTYSKAANSKAWKESFGEMAKKTVLRRLCKLIDLDFDSLEQTQAFEDGGDAKFNEQKEKYKAKDVYAEQKEAEVVIEADYKESEGVVNDFNE